MLMQTYEQELNRLQNEALHLGGLVEKSVVESVDMLKRRDPAAAQRLIGLDQHINKKRFAIEMDCLTLIVTQQPADGDLRFIASVLEIVTELERMGDYTRDTARTPFMIIDGPLQSLLIDIHRMATKTQSMLHRALEALERRDLALAQAIPAEDAQVDALYHRVYQDLLAFVRDNSQARGDSRVLVNQARYLARIARNLERTADQVPHICWWVAFAISGEMEGGEQEAFPSPASPTNAPSISEERAEESLPLPSQG
jgi:phosphate transport system protein